MVFVSFTMAYVLVGLVVGQAIRGQQYRWPDHTIPYVIDPSLYPYRAVIWQGMNDFHLKACIKFVPRTVERNYIRIFAGDGCYSFIGMTNMGRQDVSLGHGCFYLGNVVNTLGHAVGLYKTEHRLDRDNHLIIHWENIQKGVDSQLEKVNPLAEEIYTDFDVDSVMLSGETVYSKDGRSRTMEHKGGRRLLEVYEKPGLAVSDVTVINKMYGCTSSP